MTYFPIITSSRLSKEYGYTAGGTTGSSSAITQKYDDVANTWTTKSNLNTARNALSNFSLNIYGYTAGGEDGTSATEKYDDIANTWTTKANLNTGRYGLIGFSFSGYGYTAGGNVAGYSAVTEKHDDVANTWTAKTSMNTARDYLSGFSLNGYGYGAGGNTGVDSTVTEKYDDIANTWTARSALNTGRSRLSGGFTLNGYGYVAGGFAAGTSTVTEKYDDIANTWTSKATTTGRQYCAEFSINCYGYVAGGNDGGLPTALTEKYDDIANTWTAKANLNTSMSRMQGFSLGLNQSIKNPDIQEIIKYSNKEMIPVDQTASRAINGTVYTNNESSNIFITVSARCIIDTAADVANIQAFSDTNADPVAAASGIVGIEGGLAGEDVSVELPFIVRPYHKYKVVSTTSAGCSVTLGKWFETTFK